MPSPRPDEPRPGFPALVFALVSITAYAAVSLWFAVTAPESVPSRFDAAGRAYDWSSKTSVLAFLVPSGLGVPVLFSIRGLWTRIPRSLINAPHKDHWFERGEEAYFYDCLMEFLRINAGALALMFSTILISIFSAAAEDGGTGALPHVPLFVQSGGYLAVAAASVWLLFRRLKPRDRPRSGQ